MVHDQHDGASAGDDSPGAAATTGFRAGVWPLVSADEMRALDRATIEGLGVPGEILMESAGRAVAEAVLAQRAGRRGQVRVVCGTGNNGGDGFVAARHLHLLGVPTRIVVPAGFALAGLAGDAAANFERVRRLAVPVDEGRLPACTAADVVVDALFGTGLSRPLDGDAAAAVHRMLEARRAGAAVVSVDVPSGLDADTGQPLGACVEANATITIGLPKRGLALEPGRSLAGAVRVARVGILDRSPDVEPRVALWTRAAAAAHLPERPAAGHKGGFGHVLVAAGSEGKTGAAALCAEAAARSGAGLVTIACPASLNDILEQKCTEAMTVPVAETSERALASGAAPALVRLAAERDVVALGPGIGRSDETQKLVRSVAEAIERPLVLDADGLFPFGAGSAELRARSAPTIATPHPGEAAHLLGTTAAEVNADRVGAARRLAEGLGAVVVLKGACSVTAAPDGRALVNPTGGPALASGGTGDVLTGVVAAFVAQGLSAFEAAAAATWVHGLAGDRLARLHGRAGVLAGDVARALPDALRELAEQRGAEPLGGPGAGLLVRFPDP